MPNGSKMSFNHNDLGELINSLTNFYEHLFKIRIIIESKLAEGSISTRLIQGFSLYEQKMKDKFDKNLLPLINNLICLFGSTMCYQLISLHANILEEFRIIRVCRYLYKSEITFETDSQEFLPVVDEPEMYYSICQNLEKIFDTDNERFNTPVEGKLFYCSQQKSFLQPEKNSNDQQIWNEVIKTTFGDPNTDPYLNWVSLVNENKNSNSFESDLDLEFPETIFSSQNEKWFLR